MCLVMFVEMKRYRVMTLMNHERERKYDSFDGMVETGR